MTLTQEAEQHLEALNAIAVSIDVLIAEKQSTLDKLSRDIVQYTDERNAVIKEWEESQAAIAREYAASLEKKEILRKEIVLLQQEQSALVASKADLQVENVRLHKENEHFQEYEGKAMKVLKAKEKSLDEREAYLAQREGLKSKKSILADI